MPASGLWKQTTLALDMRGLFLFVFFFLDLPRGPASMNKSTQKYLAKPVRGGSWARGCAETARRSHIAYAQRKKKSTQTYLAKPVRGGSWARGCAETARRSHIAYAQRKKKSTQTSRPAGTAGRSLRPGKIPADHGPLE